MIVPGHICISGPITGCAPATPGNSCPLTACTLVNRRGDPYKSFSLTGRTGHATNPAISPAICTTFSGILGHIHDYLLFTSEKYLTLTITMKPELPVLTGKMLSDEKKLDDKNPGMLFFA
jgi:hypothetical protein